MQEQYFGAVQRQFEFAEFSVGFWLAPAPEAPLGAHGHDCAHFMFALGGRYTSGAAGEAGPHPGVLIFNPPQTFHRDRFETDGCFFSITLNRTGWNRTCEHGRELYPRHLSSIASRMVVFRLMRETAGWSIDSPLVAESLANELFGHTVGQHGSEGRRPLWLDRVCEQLRDGHASNPTFSDLAVEAGVHPHHVARTFRRFEGCTAGEYLLSIRLDRAARALANGTSSLAEIALEAGFADQSHFTKRFRAAVGLSPGEYRRRVGVGRRHVSFGQDGRSGTAQNRAA